MIKYHVSRREWSKTIDVTKFKVANVKINEMEGNHDL